MFPIEYPKDAHLEIIYSFDGIREEWGKPLSVSCGYRCAAYNQDYVHGAPLSAHQFGVALDIDVDSVQDVIKLAEIIHGLYPDLRTKEYTHTGTFIHVDCAYLINPKASLYWTRGRRMYDGE
jgi:uncharacterized protein YcbK (DUF882 family)